MSTIAIPSGRWVLVRSDKRVLSVDKADHVYLIGRGRQLPPAQTLLHKYASREQLAVVWHPPYLHIIQRGKNPTFIGPTCATVPSGPKGKVEANPTDAAAVIREAQVMFEASATVKEATARTDEAGFMTVLLPLSDPLTVTQAPDKHTISAGTIYFPDEVGLPSVEVRFECTDTVREDATAAATTKSVSEMLAVPSVRAVDEAESEDEVKGADNEDGRSCGLQPTSDSGQGTCGTSRGEKPEWQGLLDAALQEQQRHKVTTIPASLSSAVSRNAAAIRDSSQLPTLDTSRAVSTSAPSADIPFGSRSTNSADVAEAGGDAHDVGQWEWKQHLRGRDDDPKTWCRYNSAVTGLLEKAYRDPSIAKIKIPNSAMLDKISAKGYTYGVCFAEKALDGAMIQYALKDPSKFRPVRRTGGTHVHRQRAKQSHVIPSSSSSSSSEEEETESEKSVTESTSDSEESDGSSSSSSTSRESAPRAGKRQRRVLEGSSNKGTVEISQFRRRIHEVQSTM